MRKRAKHSLSHYRLHTARMGQLIPIACVPVLPGDTVQQHSSALVRAAPLNTPVMHPVNVRIHHFFVPNRLVWPESENGGWEQFITGGPDGNNNESPPTVLTSTNNKALLTFLGVPPTSAKAVNAMPVRAYGLIYNEFYRDQDLQPERNWETLGVARCAWEKDYFTTARPWTQKGADVTIPIQGQVFGGRADGSGTHPSPAWETMAGTPRGTTFDDDTGGAEVGLYTSGSAVTDEEIRFGQGSDLGAFVDSASASVNDFREAFALQRYQEARSRYGSRFTEYLRYLGVTPSDARLQRPEYLGGGVSRLNFSEVLQTSPSTQGDAGVGDLYGHGIAGVRTNKYRKFFEEHGYVISLMSVRPKAIYTQATPREFFKKTKEDYFQPEFVHLGQQEVLQREINIDDPAGTFGYQDRYDEYRQHPSQVGQDFLDVLDSWHLGRVLPDDVSLNSAFVQCDPSERIFQVETGDNLWIMVNNSFVARRLVPKVARPRIL